jgi:hypothetical protein
MTDDVGVLGAGVEDQRAHVFGDRALVVARPVRSERPVPRKSGATTVNRFPSRGMTSRQANHVCGQP